MEIIEKIEGKIFRLLLSVFVVVKREILDAKTNVLMEGFGDSFLSQGSQKYARLRINR